eukprot:g14026.t1
MLVEPSPAAEIGYRLGWASPIKLLEGQKITSVTVLGDLVLVVEDPRNVVTALDANNGELKWKIVLGSDVESLFPPSRDDKQIFIHSASRMATLNVRTGEVIAVVSLDTPVSSKGIYDPDQRLAVMFGTNGLVFGHSVDSNFPRWRYRLANRITNPGILTGQDVFVVDSGGTYALLETATGSPLWRNRTLGPVSTNAAAQGSELIVSSEDGKVYALNRTTGNDTWTYLGAEQKLTASPVALGRLIIQPLLPNAGIVAIDAINGSELWRNDVTATPILTRQQDMLLFTDSTLISMDLDDGSVITEVQTSKLQTVLPIGDDGGILLTALLSVSDKTDLVPFAQRLITCCGTTIISTGGTAKALTNAGITVTPIDQVTGFPEMMDGRVKTLHPKIHGGLLALRDKEDHAASLAEHAITPIDLVCVNLYPFEKTTANPDVSDAEAIEQIDIGGPSMVRSAAKNHAYVSIVTDPKQYDQVANNIERNSGSTTLDLRRSLASAAFTRTAEYDTAISTWMKGRFAEHPAPREA